MPPEVRFASRVYRWAAIYGIPVLLLSYLQPVPDPWHLPYIGFVGTALVFQGVFLIIASDPVRYQPIMPVTLFEKICFGVPAVLFALRGQVEPVSGVFGTIDLALAALFFVAWRRLAKVTA